MGGVKATQRNATRNQSTVDYSKNNIFTYGNRYAEAEFLNDTGADLDASDGILVLRSAVGQIKPAIAGATLADVIGILKLDDVTLVDTDTAKANYCVSGDIDAGLLKLPAGVTLDTMVGGKALRDLLTDLGFILNNVTENSKFDN
jgi:hypothetical protein